MQEVCRQHRIRFLILLTPISQSRDDVKDFTRSEGNVRHGVVMNEQQNHKATERPLGASLCHFSDHHKGRSLLNPKHAQRAAGDALVFRAELLDHLPVFMIDTDDHSPIHLRVVQMSIIDATSIADGRAECRLIEQSACFAETEADDTVGGAHLNFLLRC